MSTAATATTSATAHEVALELRRLADALDKSPETKVTKVNVSFWYFNEKAAFLDTVALLPRPLDKRYPTKEGDFERVYVEHNSPAMRVHATIYQNKLCRLIKPAQPAEFECDPLLSIDEDAGITA